MITKQEWSAACEKAKIPRSCEWIVGEIAKVHMGYPLVGDPAICFKMQQRYLLAVKPSVEAGMWAAATPVGNRDQSALGLGATPAEAIVQAVLALPEGA